MSDVWPPPPERNEADDPLPKRSAENKLRSWLFDCTAGKRSAISIIFWWELRRLPYNLVVGAVGLANLAIMYFVMTRTGNLPDGEDLVEPLAIFLVVAMMNVCYTGGWILELLIAASGAPSKKPAGPILLRGGLIFSLVVVSLPTVITLLRLVL